MKKLFSYVLIALTVFTFAFAMVACDDDTPAEHQHTPGEPERMEEVPATCLEYGHYEEVVRCADCHEILSITPVTIDPLNHNYVAETISPSYEHGGSVVYTCSRCRDTYTEQTGEKLTHTYSSAWTYDDLAHWHVCLDDGYEGLLSDKGEHNVIAYVCDPTFTEGGYTDYDCVCGYHYRSDYTEPLAHNYSEEWSSNYDGHWHVCIDAGYSNLSTRIQDHDYQTQVIEATFESQGYTLYTCKECGYHYTDNYTDVKPHNYASSWTSDENSHWKACTDAGYTELKSEEAAHSGAWTTDTAATTTANGSAHRNCAVCGKYETKTLYATGSADKLSFSLNSDQKSYSVTYTDASIAGELIVPGYHEGYPVTSMYFKGCKSITSIVLLDPITTIGYEAFSGCSALEEVTMPDSVTKIGSYAFNNCGNLTTVRLSDKLETIESRAFYSCQKLTIDEMPSTLTTIEYDAFADNHSLVFRMRIASVQEWLEKDFSDLGVRNMVLMDTSGNVITDLVIPEGVTELPSYRFAYCKNITSVQFPSTLTSLGEYTFSSCEGLTTVTIPGNVRSIGVYVFQNCTALRSVTFPNGLERIQMSAFQNCNSLYQVTIPGTVTFIGGSAFSGCRNLIEVVNYSSLTFTLDSYENGDVAAYAKQVISNPALSRLHTENGFVYYHDTDDNNILVGYTGQSDTATLPDTITKINRYALYGATQLKNLTIPSSTNVTEYGDDFLNRLDTLYLGVALNLENRVPYSHIGQVVYLDTATSIGSFSGYSGTEKVVIGNGVTSIGYRAFAWCGVKELTLGTGLTEIDQNDFDEASSIETLNFSGTVSQWNALSKAAGWNDSLTKVSVVHCSDDDVTLE